MGVQMIFVSKHFLEPMNFVGFEIGLMKNFCSAEQTKTGPGFNKRTTEQKWHDLYNDPVTLREKLARLSEHLVYIDSESGAPIHAIPRERLSLEDLNDPFTIAERNTENY